MRGKKASIARKKFDTILLAVRYEPQAGRLAMARGIERRGAVWTDLKLLDRQTLLQRLQQGHRIATGRQAELAGDLEITGSVRLDQANGDRMVLRAGAAPSVADRATDLLADDLGLPEF